MDNIELVRRGEPVRASALWRVSVGRRFRPSARIVQEGDFNVAMPMRQVHECLGPDWRGRVESAPRSGWRSPAVVFERLGWPDVVSLGDEEDGPITMQVLIEREEV